MSEFNKIMVIDDSEPTHFLTSLAIENYNDEIEVIKAYDGQEALEILDNLDVKPDLILLDINMPVMNGHEFLAAYDQKEDPAPVIVMLGSEDQHQDMAAVENHACAKTFAIKPFNIETLQKLAQL